MKPFTEIGAYRHTVTSVKKFCSLRNKPLPTITYVGTVKLHGTNAGVRITPEAVQPQKRTDIVTIGADNAGFAVFCHDKQDKFREIAKIVAPDSSDFTFFGEWCGGNIQKGVALAQLEKHFVIFSGYDATAEKYVNILDITVAFLKIETGIDGALFLDKVADIVQDMNKIGVYFVDQVSGYTITIDFSKAEDALQLLDELTLEVEKECPWGKFRGVSGTGEGIVWTPDPAFHPDLAPISDLWFKTKGLEHKRTNVTTGTKTEASPERLATIREVVDRVLPEWRSEQGLTHLKDQGLAISPENTGVFLQWVSKDILKEDADILAENQLEWKFAVKYIMPQARQYFMNTVNNEAFSKED